MKNLIVFYGALSTGVKMISRQYKKSLRKPRKVPVTGMGFLVGFDEVASSPTGVVR
jgi:hypothetical protein